MKALNPYFVQNQSNIGQATAPKTLAQPLLGNQIPGKQSFSELTASPTLPMPAQPMFGQRTTELRVPGQPMVGQVPAQPMMGQPLQPSTPTPNGSLAGPMFQQLPRAVQKQLANGQQLPQSAATAERKARRLTGLGKYSNPDLNYMGGSPNFNEQTGTYNNLA